MADIFVSYDSRDRDRIKPLVEALQAKGWSVWWDRDITPGRRWAETIDKELSDARCVVVLWTAESIESEWVNTEAQEGLERNILVPALLDEVRIPLTFRRTQCADLQGSGPPRQLMNP